MFNSHLLGAILLVAGTTIGAAMLALPIVTGFTGFGPTLLLFFSFWLLMLYTAFLLVEVNSWVGPRSNLITMARKTLGRPGEVVSWIIYLFLLYTLSTAYLAGSGPIFLAIIENMTSYNLPEKISPLFLLVIFSFLVYKGARFVDYANRFLMLGLSLSFALLLFYLFKHVDLKLLTRSNFDSITFAIPFISTSFGFHIIIPTLMDYLDRDTAQVKRAILIGSSLPLITYICWEVISLGILPLEGPVSITTGYAKGINGAALISKYLDSKIVFTFATAFSLFAIITSFLGVSLSLRDFLADGLKIKKNHSGKIILYLLTFGPPLAASVLDPRAFLNALEYAGTFGVITLLVIIPPLMVWQGRKLYPDYPRTPGGKLSLLVVMAVGTLILLLNF